MTKVQIAILWGLALAIVIVFALLGWLISRPPGRGAPLIVPTAEVYHLSPIPQSARGLYPRAEQAARSWQEDARLVSAVASWSFVKAEDFSRPVGWTFQFFSPSTQRTYIVHADDAQVVQIFETLSPYPLPTVPVDQWQLDSHHALSAWLNGGGGRFLRTHPVVDVSARLSQTKGGRLQWIVVGVVKGTQIVQSIRVDAANGSVLE